MNPPMPMGAIAPMTPVSIATPNAAAAVQRRRRITTAGSRSGLVSTAASSRSFCQARLASEIASLPSLRMSLMFSAPMGIRH